jgi:DNA-binding NtrC family response regulator
MKNSILLVEDDASLAASLERVLVLAGYRVTVAASAEAGLKHLNESRFAVVVTDFKLPCRTGLDLVKQIQAANDRVPIILITAHGTAELAIEATNWARTIIWLSHLRCQTCLS